MLRRDGKGSDSGQGQCDPGSGDHGGAVGKLNPQSVPTYVMRATTYTFLGMDSEAQQDANRAVELGFDLAVLRRMMEEAKNQR